MSSTNINSVENRQRKVELASSESYLNYLERRFKSQPCSSEEDPNCSLASVRAKAREYKKQSGPPPSFRLLESGTKARLNLVDIEINTIPLYAGDVQQLVLKAVLNLVSPCSPRWCSLHQGNNLRNVHLVIVEGLSKQAVLGNLQLFQNVTTFFNDMIEVVTPYRYASTFAADLCELPIFSYEVKTSLEIKEWNIVPCNTHKPLSSLVPVTDPQVGDSNPNEGFSRLHLLLSPIQLVVDDFPLPQETFECKNTEGYKFTKDIYSPVTSKSPMFAIDCEMCCVASGRKEVTRVAIVDEKLQTVYCTLVKPREKVTNYLAKLSGVTKKMLRKVTTRLEDVQDKIKELLPPDAILCGQSVNFDLHALKMIHPYVIDTSVIYNTTGRRARKTKLKVLSSTFLKEEIQNGVNGHHPVEDCIAAMKLVQLKLEKGPQFGDSILSKILVETVSKDDDGTENRWNDSSVKCPKTDISTSFFAQFPAAKKNSLIIVHNDFEDLYPEKMLNEVVGKETVCSNEDVLQHTLEKMSNYNLTISHLRFPTCSHNAEALFKIDKWVGMFYEGCSVNSMLVFVGTGLKSYKGSCENGFCQVKIKDE